MSAYFTLKCIGLSRDGHTNVWLATCRDCGKEHQPPTTMFATQKLTCPRCGNSAEVDYNKESAHEK